MSLPLNIPFAETVQWCSIACKGSPAEYRIIYAVDGGTKEELLVCEACLEFVKAHGPYSIHTKEM